MIWKKASYGEPIHTQEAKITPHSESIGVDFPFGGLVWNRPVAVISIGPEGVEVEPIVDMTKIGLALLTTIGSKGLMFLRIKRKK